MGYYKLLLLFLSILFLTSCAGASEQGSGQVDYEETKKMVVDILKTDDGKKAIQEVMKDDSMKQALVMDQAIVTDTIQKTLTSEQGIAFWKKTFEDPKFAETFAKSMQPEHEKLIKGLMKDPEYQKMLIELFQNPEAEEQVLTVLKSAEYRAHLQQVITETFESPLFKAKLVDVIIKSAEQLQEQAAKTKQEGGGGGEGDS
ncbi:spore germination lipoprotein GerD [Bacillus pinisoli]|uniref:spore germination lipoprotein GerD n=1 Tax=Bacillus pinisoli TaxID=2901866 RepID=UPI001FF36830|nr:spore germination lipoprotein GerD [Bacillus pinisoli]